MGRVFMSPLECPFRVAEREIEKLRKKTRIIFVDIHAEATSEKEALGWFLDGRVSAVVGTHTHVQTADEQILPEGTAYITDAGMTGPFNSIIGMRKDIILERFLVQIPNKFIVAKDDVRLQGVIIDIDDNSGKAKDIHRLTVKLTS
jgi:metallophosphoesterase (TIGR00282 family)